MQHKCPVSGLWGASLLSSLMALMFPVLPSVRQLRAIPGEAGDAAVLSSLSEAGQVQVLDRLDFVLSSLVALRREVEELKSSLQGLAGEIIGEVR